MKIGITACAANPVLSPSNERFRQSLINRGIDAPVLLWNRHPYDEFLKCDLIILRQTWDCQADPGGFAAWLTRLEALGGRVEAPAALAVWNNDKRTLMELGDMGVAIPQMIGLPEGTDFQLDQMLDADKIVLKPAFGGDGVGVALCHRADFWKTLAQVRSIAPGRPIIAQEFLPEIALGEWKISMIEGQTALAVHAIPKGSEFRINSRFGPEIKMAKPPVAAQKCAEFIMELVGTPLCGRVDGVMRNGEFICTELELTDPDLHLHYDTKIADTLAERTIARAQTDG